MRLRLNERERNDALVTLAAELPYSATPLLVRYRTRTGALARVDGLVAGAFDREHHSLLLPSGPVRELTLEVERKSLPTNGLPPGPGLRWMHLLATASAEPQRFVDLEPARANRANGKAPAPPQPLWGHGHLDVAWLWTYDQARRKAARTFANALGLIDGDPAFVFAQSQPQLYAFVRDEDAGLYARAVRAAREGRFDPSVAAMWVEPDCNVPSGESLLRQMLFAHRFCLDAFGAAPSIAWLPDTFGFARTLPTLLAHAGIAYFATTKLQWNDTTRFPYHQFRWRGPDGSEVVAASIDRMEGGATAARVRVARERGEPLIVGYGDGGGGPTVEQLHEAASAGTWERPERWFERLNARRGELPVHDDELYLEYHRGVYTTHRDVKRANAELERKLAVAEEQAAWCLAVRAAPEVVARVRAALRDAWEIVLRNQFHDVLPGTSIAEVYVDARAEYVRAHELCDRALASAAAMLPRAARAPRAPARSAPVASDGGYDFDNGIVRARVLPSGTIVEIASRGGRSVVAQANGLALYRDRPKKWEAWNVDASYMRHMRPARPHDAAIVDGALEVRFSIGASPATMRLVLLEDEPFLRVELAIDWRERRKLLRLENWLALRSETVTYGAPHGTVARSSLTDTPERRARYEVPGQRFAVARDGDGAGLALLALDTYGWSARTLERGGLRLGHSLLRATTWPDPHADAGEHQFAWAFAPLQGESIGTIERWWERFAGDPSVRLFASGDGGVAVAACKPAEDGDGAIVRLRECDGNRREVRLRCGARMRSVETVDALERPVAGEARIEGEEIAATIPAFGLLAFRVRF
ncbi:MAG TPA: glycoside hydrolase family 38 C-terminal domain-containing protein [Candidatus Acidoferrales bacterium]|nr:glycoside hydrolase family 38 C-terminal domain-containing protein [Candidatus Acidoferrales bacterium]